MKITLHMKDCPDITYKNVWDIKILGGGILAIYERGPDWDYAAPRFSPTNDYGDSHKFLLGSFIAWSTEPEENDDKALSLVDLLDQAPTPPPDFGDDPYNRRRGVE
jgi:hypothetical protein